MNPLLDPGANVHVVADISLLSHVQPITGTPVVLEGINCEATSVGLFARQLLLHNGTRKTVMLPAYHSPDLPSRTTAGHRVIISQSAMEKQYDAGLTLPRPSSGTTGFVEFPEGRLPVHTRSGLYFIGMGQPAPVSARDYSKYSRVLAAMQQSNVGAGATTIVHDHDRASLYHHRFGHASAESLRRQLKHFGNLGYTNSDVDSLKFCDDCAVSKAKQTEKSRTAGTNPDRVFLQLSTDLYGPVNGPAGTPPYALGVVDHYSGYVWLRFLQSKGEAPEALNSILTTIRTIFNRRFPNTPWSCTLKADSESIYSGAGTSDICLRHHVDPRISPPSILPVPRVLIRYRARQYPLSR